MSVYLKLLRTNVAFNSDDYNYQDESISYHTGDERYLRNSGDVSVSYANNTIFEGSINETPAECLENIVSNIQSQIDGIAVNSDGVLFLIYAESKNVNSTVNNGHNFSFGSSVTFIHDLRINGDCILNKVCIDLLPTITNIRTDAVVIEIWYKPCANTLLLYPDEINEAIATITISTSQTFNFWDNSKTFYDGDLLQIVVVSGGNCSSGLLEGRATLTFHTLGIRGERGIQGIRGERGYVGSKGEMGFTGATGDCGRMGIKGPNGGHWSNWSNWSKR